MSYAMSGALQSAIYDALKKDVTLSQMVDGNVYDAVPEGTMPDLYVSIGRERVRDASDQSKNGALHDFDVSVVTKRPGFAGAKAAAGAVSDVLHDADLELSRGRLVFLRFERADARRFNNNLGREIRLRFRARVEDN